MLISCKRYSHLSKYKIKNNQLVNVYSIFSKESVKTLKVRTSVRTKKTPRSVRRKMFKKNARRLVACVQKQQPQRQLQ